MGHVSMIGQRDILVVQVKLDKCLIFVKFFLFLNVPGQPIGSETFTSLRYHSLDVLFY